MMMKFFRSKQRPFIPVPEHAEREAARMKNPSSVPLAHQAEELKQRYGAAFGNFQLIKEVEELVVRNSKLATTVQRLSNENASLRKTIQELNVRTHQNNGEDVEGPETKAGSSKVAVPEKQEVGSNQRRSPGTIQRVRPGVEKLVTAAAKPCRNEEEFSKVFNDLSSRLKAVEMEKWKLMKSFERCHLDAEETRLRLEIIDRELRRKADVGEQRRTAISCRRQIQELREQQRQSIQRIESHASKSSLAIAEMETSSAKVAGAFELEKQTNDRLKASYDRVNDENIRLKQQLLDTQQRFEKTELLLEDLLEAAKRLLRKSLEQEEGWQREKALLIKNLQESDEAYLLLTSDNEQLMRFKARACAKLREAKTLLLKGIS